jgi:predicted nucleotidyltransferase
MGVTEIVAGSENNDINIIDQTIAIEQNTEFQNEIKNNLDKGFSYRKSYSLALEKHSINLPSNDMLNVKYLQAIQQINPNIKLTLIKRINNNYNDIKLNDSSIQSATAIRNTNNIQKYVPEYINQIYLNKGFYNLNQFTPILKHLLLTLNLSSIFQANEGIENSFNTSFNNIDELVNKLTTKRYTNTRIKRFISYVITHTTKEEISEIDKTVIRVTGFNENGQKYLNQKKKDITYFTRLTNKINNIYDKELLIAKIFSNIYDEDFIKIEQSLPYIRK